jgi:hypothetical protein
MPDTLRKWACGEVNGRIGKSAQAPTGCVDAWGATGATN